MTSRTRVVLKQCSWSSRLVVGVIANFELSLERTILAHYDEALLGAALFEDAAQEDFRGPLVVLLGEEELRDLEQLLVERHVPTLHNDVCFGLGRF